MFGPYILVYCFCRKGFLREQQSSAWRVLTTCIYQPFARTCNKQAALVSKVWPRDERLAKKMNMIQNMKNNGST
eukprot:2072547-Amphidinium_carterae.1